VRAIQHERLAIDPYFAKTGDTIKVPMQRLAPIAAIIGLSAVGCGDNGGAPSDARVDAPVDVAPDACVPNLRVETFTSQELIIPATSNTATAALTAPLDRTILFTSIRHNEPGAFYGAVHCYMHPEQTTAPIKPAGITCEKFIDGTDNPASTGQIHIRWTAVTFSGGVRVQRGLSDTNTVNPAVITLSPAVDPAHSFVLLGGGKQSGNSYGNNDFSQARLLNGTTLDIRQAAAGSHVAWQVVEMDGASVTRGTASMTDAEMMTEPAVPSTPNGLLLATYNVDTPAAVAANLMVQANLEATKIVFKRSGAAVPVTTIAWELVSLPYPVTKHVTNFAIGEVTKTETVSGLSAARSVALGSIQALSGQSSGSTTNTADDNVGESSFTLTSGAGMVTVERATALSAASLGWSTIDFATDPACN